VGLHITVVALACMLASCSLVRLDACDEVSYVRIKHDVEIYAKCKA
jgi:hypothetical protein